MRIDYVHELITSQAGRQASGSTPSDDLVGMEAKRELLTFKVSDQGWGLIAHFDGWVSVAPDHGQGS